MAKVLVVDDIEDNIKLLCYNLEDDGHLVVTADNGEACLAQAKQHAPDIILLDMMMPGLSGTETLEQLKQTPNLANIPVIMVSANDDDDAIIGAIDIGAHDYIAKPFIYPVLAARMRSALRLKESQEALEAANQTLSNLASLDPLTEIYNRRYFFNLANVEFAKAQRHQHPLSVIMLDVDHFKKINDSFGHGAGDQALVKLTSYCQDTGRESDIISRFGGEEFAICCADTDIKGAMALAERIRKTIEDASFEFEGHNIQFTASLGVTSLQPSDHEFEELISRADKYLYEAKNAGRNCCKGDI